MLQSPNRTLFRVKRPLTIDACHSVRRTSEQSNCSQSGPVSTPVSDEFKARMVQELAKRLGGDTRKASALETVLMRHTPTIFLQKHFNEPSEALNYALKQVALSLMGRIARKEELEQCRSYRLERALGEERYQEVMALVREIKLLRLSRAGAACAGPQCALSPKRSSDRHHSLPMVIPCPVNQLFFHNSLVEVVDHAPLATLPDQDWDGLVRQAKQDLRDYLEWSERKASPHQPPFDPHFFEPVGATATEYFRPTKRPRRISDASGNCT